MSERLLTADEVADASFTLRPRRRAEGATGRTGRGRVHRGIDAQPAAPLHPVRDIPSRRNPLDADDQAGELPYVVVGMLRPLFPGRRYADCWASAGTSTARK